MWRGDVERRCGEEMWRGDVERRCGEEMWRDKEEGNVVHTAIVE
jgi:hypothetical protein